MAILIKTDGTENIVQPKNGRDFKLEEAQKYVDGYVEVVNLRNGTILIVNEEGKFTKGPNRKATEIALEHNAIFPFDYIAGDVLLCNEKEFL